MYAGIFIVFLKIIPNSRATGSIFKIVFIKQKYL